MKICPVEAELFHVDTRTDGRTDRHDKANHRFLQFCRRGQKRQFLLQREHVLVFVINNS
jgi:hypothetical protein